MKLTQEHLNEIAKDKAILKLADECGLKQGYRIGVSTKFADIIEFSRALTSELEKENAVLLAQVKEWVCEDCNTVYPGPPQKGFKCVVCPQCNGHAIPRALTDVRKLERANRELQIMLQDSRREILFQAAEICDKIASKASEKAGSWEDGRRAGAYNCKHAILAILKQIDNYKNNNETNHE